MNTLSEAIKSLEISTQAIDKFINDPKYYNNSYCHYLESISWEMHKQAIELKELSYQLGV